MDLQSVRVFVSVAHEGSLKRAAEAAYLSPSRVSQIVAQLEREVGCDLLDRSARALKLTKNGVKFVELFDPVLTHWTTAETEFGQFSHGAPVVISLGFFSSAGYKILPMLMREVATKHDGIVILPRSYRYSHEVCSAVSSGKVDLGIVRAPLSDSSLSATKIVTDRFVVCFSTGQAPDRGSSAGELLRSNTVFAYPADSPSDVGNQSRSLIKRVAGTQAHTLSVTDTLSMLSMVSAGQGVAVIPFSSMDLNVPNVSFIDLEDSPALEISLCWRQTSIPRKVKEHIPTFVKAVSALQFTSAHKT